MPSLYGHPEFSIWSHCSIQWGSVICLYCRSVSQDLSETILTMVGNCSILLTKPRQAPPGVLRHRGIEPTFNPSSLGGQVSITVWYITELQSHLSFLFTWMLLITVTFALWTSGYCDSPTSGILFSLVVHGWQGDILAVTFSKPVAGCCQCIVFLCPSVLISKCMFCNLWNEAEGCATAAAGHVNAHARAWNSLLSEFVH